MAQDDTFEGLEDGAERLNETLGATATLVAGFDAELRRMRSALAAPGCWRSQACRMPMTSRASTLSRQTMNMDWPMDVLLNYLATISPSGRSIWNSSKNG